MRFRVPLAKLLPRYARRNAGAFVIFMVMFSTPTIYIAWKAAVGSLLVFAFFLPPALLVALVLTVLTWPFRFARYPAPSEDYYLRYFTANRRETVRASASSIDVPAGVFSLECLQSLRVCQIDGYLGLYTLVFEGQHTSAQLFSWPGLPIDTAMALRQSLIERTESV